MDDLREEMQRFREDVLNRLGEIEERLAAVERKVEENLAAAQTYNPNFDQIGNAFVQHYYSKFNEPNPVLRAENLALLYHSENSFLTFEGNQVKGKQAIREQWNSLPFGSIQHAITKTDCQPLADGTIAVAVSGKLKTDEDHINSFSHCFVLKPNAAGSFFIANEILTLFIDTF
ncbi:nuclear transport factor 2 (NTF2) domain-containing protein [Ditylenchus destructor]|nr:nuclear transport factor 2 (NTF2) domain-containing protein [Ditylenchus destructor]